MSVRLKINGEDRVSASDPLSPLVDVLRDEFFLTERVRGVTVRASGSEQGLHSPWCGPAISLSSGKF